MDSSKLYSWYAWKAYPDAVHESEPPDGLRAFQARKNRAAPSFSAVLPSERPRLRRVDTKDLSGNRKSSWPGPGPSMPAPGNSDGPPPPEQRTGSERGRRHAHRGVGPSGLGRDETGTTCPPRSTIVWSGRSSLLVGAYSRTGASPSYRVVREFAPIFRTEERVVGEGGI